MRERARIHDAIDKAVRKKYVPQIDGQHSSGAHTKMRNKLINMRNGSLLRSWIKCYCSIASSQRYRKSPFIHSDPQTIEFGRLTYLWVAVFPSSQSNIIKNAILFQI